MIQRADVRAALLMQTLAVEVQGLVLLVGEEYLTIRRVTPDVTVKGRCDLLGIVFNETPRVVFQLTPEVVIVLPLGSVQENTVRFQ